MRRILNFLRLRLPKEKNASEVLRGGSIAFLYRIGSMVVSYGLMWFISRQLGETGWGIYNIALAVLGIFVMIGCLGFNTSIVRFVSQYNLPESSKNIQRLYNGILKITLPLSILLGLILYFSSDLLATWFFKDNQLGMPLKISAFFIPVIVLVTINVEFIRGLKIIHISEYFRNLNLQIINLAGVFLMATFFALNNSHPVLYYGIGGLISLFFTQKFIIKYFRKDVTIEDTATSPSFPTLRWHLLASIPMILTSFIQLFNGKVDIIMLGAFSTTAVVGIFSLALKLSVITNFVIGALKTIAMPKISELFWQNNLNELDKVIQYSTRLIFYFAAPVSLILFIFPETILGFVKEEFIAGATTLRIFAVMQLLNAASGMVAPFLNMTGNQVFFTRLIFIATLVNIALNFLLIPSFGMEGAAIASLISIVLWNFSGVIFIYKRYKILTLFNPFSVGKG